MRLRLVPKPFTRRIRHFLDKGVGIEPNRRAGQKGIFQEYEIYDAVELGIALSIQNVGLPQLETTQYVLRFRDELRSHVKLMPTTNLPDSSGVSPFPDFLIVKPLALNETVRQFGEYPALRVGDISFFPPEFIATKEQWHKLAFHEIGPGSERVVIDLGSLVSSLNSTLPEIPRSKRGRQ